MTLDTVLPFSPREAVSLTERVTDKLADANTPGFAAEFDPEEAEWAGAFEETAISEEEARDSTMDME